MTNIISDLRELPPNFRLLSGAHTSFAEGACFMEAVAYVAGEPHSDHPVCACPALAAAGRRLNDRLDADERQLLAPLIPRLVGTRADYATVLARVFALVDGAVREVTPLGLQALKWDDLAAQLRELPPITDRESARSAHAVIQDVRKEARKRADAADAAYAAASASAYADAASAYAASAYAASASAYADAASAYAASASAYADAASAYADAAAYAYASASAAADAYASASAAAGLTPEQRKQLRAEVRRPIVEVSIRVFERAIAIAAPQEASL